MNPHTKDFRHHALSGEKTWSAFQGFKPRSERPSAWLIFSTIVTVAVFLIALCALPWEGGW